jgi:hypothetical protein
MSVEFAVFASQTIRAKNQQCPLLSKSGQTLVRLHCPLSANSGGHRTGFPIDRGAGYGAHGSALGTTVGLCKIDHTCSVPPATLAGHSIGNQRAACDLFTRIRSNYFNPQIRKR